MWLGWDVPLWSVPQNKRSCTVELEREIRVAFSQPVCAELGIFCVGESLGKCWAVEVIPRDVMSVCWGCGDLLERDREGKCWQSFLLPTGQHRGGESGWAFLGSFCCSGTSRVPFVLFQTESGKTGHAVPQPWEWFPFDKPAFDATSILSGLFFFCRHLKAGQKEGCFQSLRAALTWGWKYFCGQLLLVKTTQNLEAESFSTVSVNKHFSWVEIHSQGDPATLGLPKSSAGMRSGIDDGSCWKWVPWGQQLPELEHAVLLLLLLGPGSLWPHSHSLRRCFPCGSQLWLLPGIPMKSWLVSLPWVVPDPCLDLWWGQNLGPGYRVRVLLAEGGTVW